MRFGFRLSSDDLPELKLNSLESHAQPFWCYTDVVPSLKSAEASEEDHECGLAVRRDLAASDLRTLDGGLHPRTNDSATAAFWFLHNGLF